MVGRSTSPRMGPGAGDLGVTNATELPLVAQCESVCGRAGRHDRARRREKKRSPTTMLSPDVIIRLRPTWAFEGRAPHDSRLSLAARCACIPAARRLGGTGDTHLRASTVYTRPSTRESSPRDSHGARLDCVIFGPSVSLCV